MNRALREEIEDIAERVVAHALIKQKDIPPATPAVLIGQCPHCGGDVMASGTPMHGWGYPIGSARLPRCLKCGAECAIQLTAKDRRKEQRKEP